MGLRTGVFSALYSLRFIQYRYLWLGHLTVVTAQMMDTITRTWLIYSMTNSAIHLTLVFALRSLPLLFFGLIVGALVDRFDRRKLLFISQLSNLFAHLFMGVAILFAFEEIWMVYATSLIMGTGMALEPPSRNSMIPATVPKKGLQNAAVLNASTLNIGQAVGPVIAGFMIEGMGISATFFVQGFLCLLGVFMTIKLSSSVSVVPKKLNKESMFTSIIEGLRYVQKHEMILGLLIIAIIPLFFGNPVQSVLPIFSEDILKAGADGAGLLLGTMGAGTMLATLVLIFLPNFKRYGRTVVLATMAYCLFILLFSISTKFWLSLSLMFFAGICLSLFRTMHQSIILSNTTSAYLGRVNSLYLLCRGMVPLGTMGLGVLTEFTQVTFAVGTMSVLGMIFTLGSVLIFQSLWREKNIN